MGSTGGKPGRAATSGRSSRTLPERPEAGLLVELAHYTGFGLMVAAFPVILFVFLAYRMYLQNVEMSVAAG